MPLKRGICAMVQTQNKERVYLCKQNQLIMKKHRTASSAGINKKTALILLIAPVLAIVFYRVVLSDFSKDSDAVYFGGDILTMSDEQPFVEAVYVKNGKIEAIGPKADVLKRITKSTKHIDLQGKTLMPGFFDAHGHYDLAAVFYSMTDVSGVSYRRPQEVWARIENAVKNAPAGQWVYCYGFDPILTAGVENPTLAYMDSIAPNNPLVIITKALHVFYVNSQAFSALGITNKTPDPSAASYYEKDAAGKLTGAIVEQEALEPIRIQILADVMSNFVKNTRSIMTDYAQMGVTSAVNMGLSANKKTIFSLYEHLAAEKPKPLYQLLAFAGKLPKRAPNPRLFIYLRKDNFDLLPEKARNTDDFYKIIGIKMWYDGSPYSGSMFLKQPYIQSKFTIEGIHLSPNHTSESLLTEEELQGWIEKIQAKNFPVAVHAQGDRANDEVVDVFKKIHAKNAINHYRHRIEHCMLLPKERLSDMKNMSITPSFHINHILYYGDFLDKEILGEERAARIFPLQSTLEAGLPYSLHADMPQFVPSPLALAHTSVHRQTESGAVYNENERVSVMQALKSITIHAAWQLHLEDKLGSIEKGKYADLVILDQNPLKTTSEQMTSIRVLETIVAGNTVWKQQAAPGAAQ